MDQLLHVLKSIPEYAALLEGVQQGQSAAVSGIGQINQFQNFVNPALVHNHAAVGDLADFRELGGEDDDGLAALGQPERERDLLERAEMVYEGT